MRNTGHARGAGRLEVVSWWLYDFASSAFTTIVVTVAFSIYFKDRVAPRGTGDLYWGICDASAMLLSALLAPFLGALADQSGRRKTFLLSFASLSILCTALLCCVGPGDLVLGIGLFILSDIGFNGGGAFYDSFLPEISTPGTMGRISGFGWGFGYVGGLTSMAIAYPFLRGGYESPGALASYRLGFLTTAAQFALFTLPVAVLLRERASRPRTGGAPGSILARGLARLRDTLGHIRRHREAAKFLAAYFFYSNAINTIIVFSSIYAREVFDFSVPEVMVFFITVQTLAVLGAVVSGPLVDRFGPRVIIMACLLLWIAIVLGAYFAGSKRAFYLVGALAGIGIGSTQPSSRTLMAYFTPEDRRAEFFGFFSAFNKFSGILGPAAFGIMSVSAGGTRPAILSTVGFFLLGLLILRSVREPETSAGA